MANGLSGPLDPSQFSTTPLSGSMDPSQFSVSGPVYGPTYPFSTNQNNSNTQTGSGQGFIGPDPNNVDFNGLHQAIQGIINQSKNTPDATPPSVTIDPKEFVVNPVNSYEKQVTDPTTTTGQKFNAYYQKLLDQAQGDVNEAIRIMQYHYNTGTARINQDAALQSGRQTEDLTSALDKLGITFGQEKNTALDTLNKRGIAVTQAGGPGSASTKVAGTGTVTYDAQGNPKYSGQDGQAGTELSMLSEDQKLRKEAQVRTSQRAIQDIGIKQTQGLKDTAETQTESNYSIGSNAAQKQDQINQQKEQETLQKAQLLQSQDLAQQQMNLQKAQMKASGINI